MLPELTGRGLEQVEEPPADVQVAHQPLHVHLIVVEKLCTIANHFGLSRLYKGRPC